MSVIFTNGCFDIVHRGHLELLKYCRSLGNKVIVGLNSDISVKKIKGKRRPINNQNDRKFLLESLIYVDEVIIFEENTPYQLIKKIKPDIIVKGGDYTVESVVGKDISEVRIFKNVEGYSTTRKIQDIVNR
jgi:D-beta-D-heptose 7-phosphate kinase/D-beta-D-heptose 1-phosphate adenosyltransferase